MTEKITYVCDVCGKEYAPHSDARSQCLTHEKECAIEKIEQLAKKYKPRIVLYVVTWYKYDPNYPSDKTLMTNLFLNYTAAVNFKNKWSFGFHNPWLHTLDLNYAEE